MRGTAEASAGRPTSFGIARRARTSTLFRSWLGWTTLSAAATAAALVTIAPRWAALGFAALVIAVLVGVRPALAAYLIIGLTPLIVGIDRGHVVPFFRPNEAVALLVGSALIGRGVLRLRTGRLPRLRPDSIDVAIVLLAVTSSIVPVLWMLVRHREVTSDDVLYALVLWKYYGIYLIVRASVATAQQVRRCLWISMAAASIVALVAILESLGLFGVPRLLAAYYASPWTDRTLMNMRGSSTLSLPAAVADLMVINLAIAAGLWLRDGKHRALLVCGAIVFVFGALGSGQFSGAIGLLVGVLALAVITGRLDLVAPFGVVAVIASGVLRQVIDRRLVGFRSASGLPESWIGRLHNLRYFWPELFSKWNFLLGVRPSARIPAPKETGKLFIWIESGYTWLLWGGGIPLLGSFVFFVWATTRRSWEVAHRDRGAIGVAAVASFVGVVVMTVLMAFDPHLTYRGSADALFALIALTGVPADQGGDRRRIEEHGSQPSLESSYKGMRP
jgi:hypothetical protein